jgi:hypothetical protein
MSTTRNRAARVLTGVLCLGFLATAALHSTGYSSVVSLASEVQGTMGDLMPALWLAFAVDLAVLGLIVGVLAVRAPQGARPILVVIALCPFAAAALQLRFIGFIPPTALLIGLGVLSWVDAAVWRES